MTKWKSDRRNLIHEIARKSTGLVDEIIHQKQPNDKTCVHTCLAMVTGLPVSDIIKVYGDHTGLTYWDEETFLGLAGIRYRDISLHSIKPASGIFMATIQSLNHENVTHRIVLSRNTSEKWKVFDPNEGVENKNSYDASRLWSHKAFNWVFLENANYFVPPPYN